MNRPWLGKPLIDWLIGCQEFSSGKMINSCLLVWLCQFLCTPRAVFEWFQTSNRTLIAHRIDMPTLLLNGAKPVVFRSIIPGIILIHCLFKVVTVAIIRIHIKSGTVYCSWTIGLFLPDYLWAKLVQQENNPAYADFWFSTGTYSLYINLFTDFNSRGKEAFYSKMKLFASVLWMILEIRPFAKPAN